MSRQSQLTNFFGNVQKTDGVWLKDNSLLIFRPNKLESLPNPEKLVSVAAFDLVRY